MIDARKRLTSGVNRARLQIELKRSVAPAIVVALGLGLGLLLAGYVVSNVSRTALARNYEVRFEVADATAVQANVNEVRFKGVPVGTITKVAIDGDRPVITAKIQRKYGRLYRDARAELRPNTALQNMYLDVVSRGTKAAGELGEDDMLPRAQTQMPVNVSDVLNVFQPSERLRLRTLLDELGNGMADRGRSLRDIFVRTAPLLTTTGEITAQLAQRGPLVRRLVHNTSVLTGELGQRDEQIRTLVGEGSAVLGTLQQDRGDLDATLRELPPTMTGIDASFATVRSVLPAVDGAVGALRPVARNLPESLRALRELSDDAAPAVADLQRPVRDLVPLATTLRPLSGDLDRAIGGLLPLTDSIDHATAVGVQCKTGFQHFFQWNASIAKFGDSRGPVPRGNVVLGAQSSSALNDPQEYAPEACSGGSVVGGRPAGPGDRR